VGAGDRRFAITGSGNAALAAALHIKKLNETGKEPTELEIYTGNHISPAKLEKLQPLADDHVVIRAKERPLQALMQAVDEGFRSLRQSNDDEALVGYGSLAEELAGIKNAGAVFIGTSSGTTSQALADHFTKKKLPIQVHIVQTSSCHPLVDAFEAVEAPDERSTADAIVDQTALRKSKLIPLIKKTGGQGWCATNDDIAGALELVKKHTGLDISTNSALSVVGAMHAASMGYEIDGVVICMICGD
jgi:threonine dehydratase